METKIAHVDVQLVVGSAGTSRHFLPAINFCQLVQCLARARIWQRVRHLSFACEQWVGPVSHTTLMHMHSHRTSATILTALYTASSPGKVRGSVDGACSTPSRHAQVVVARLLQD